MAETKVQSKMRRRVDRGDLTIGAACAELKEEILNEVRAVSGGYKQTIFPMVELGKQLLELEEIQKAAKPETKKPAGKKPTGVGIKAVAQVEETEDEDEDEFADL